MTTMTYTVEGMTCGHCVASIKREVGAVPGVESVDVQLSGGKVTVDSASELDREIVRAAVEEAGYELAEDAPVVGVDLLGTAGGGCCGGGSCACGH